MPRCCYSSALDVAAPDRHCARDARAAITTDHLGEAFSYRMLDRGMQSDVRA